MYLCVYINYLHLCRYLDDNAEELILEPYITTTEMRLNPYYSIYYINPATLLVLGIIPMILLAYWNYIIYQHIKTSSDWQEEHSHRSTGSARQKQENEFAKVLIGIVVTFVCCHILRIILNFHEAIVIKDLMACDSEGKEGLSLWPQITNEFNKLMLVLNSSVNMIIYCCLNSKLRNFIAYKMSS